MKPLPKHCYPRSFALYCPRCYNRDEPDKRGRDVVHYYLREVGEHARYERPTHICAKVVDQSATPLVVTMIMTLTTQI